MQGRLLLIIFGVTMFLLAILPGRFSAWLERPLVALVEMSTAPVAAPVNWAVRLVRRSPSPGFGGTGPVAEEVERLRQDAATFKVLYARALDEKERLERQIDQLNRGLALNPALPVRQFPAAVIGFHADLSSSLMKVRAGSVQGVLAGTVAVYDGVNLIGRVLDPVSDRVSRILPITDRQSGELKVAIFPGDLAPGRVSESSAQLAAATNPAIALGGPSLAANLTPRGDGSLVGFVFVLNERPGQPAPVAEVGTLVRLRHEAAWPRSAQMLVVGAIERVQTNERGRQFITVRPLFDVQRLSEVTLRLCAEDADAASPAGSGGSSGTPTPIRSTTP